MIYNKITLPNGGGEIQDSCITLYSGDTASDVTINANGQLTVADGTASNIILNAGGYLFVYSGTVSNVTVAKGAFFSADGGKITNVTFKKGAVFKAFTFTANTKCADLKTISNVTVGYYCCVGAADFCDAKTLSNVTVNNGGSLYVQDGGKVTNVTLGKGGSLQVDSGKVTNLTVNKGYSSLGIMDISSISNVTFKKGAEYGAFTFTADTKCATLKTISNVTMAQGSFCSVGTVNPYCEAKSVSNVTVSKDSQLLVEDGGKTSNVTISKGGHQRVQGTGKTTDVTINAGGELTACYGGTVSGVTVKKGASLQTYEGSQDGDGGKVTTITVKKGGIVNAFVFASDTKLKNLSNISNVTMVSGESTKLSSKQTVSNVTLSGEKTKLSVRGGTVTKATVGSGARVHVKEGATGTDFTVKNGGTVTVEEGGLAKNVKVENGGTLELDDGKASSITVQKGGRLEINDDGSGTITGGASKITLAKGATINGFSWSKDMTFKTFSKITGATVAAGEEAWVVGKQSVSDLVLSGKNTKLIVDGFGTANNITVNSGSELEMSGGGTATNITVKRGGILNGITFKKETKYASAADFLNANLADNTDDTKKAASGQKAALSGETISGWVGLKDAKDFIKIQLRKKGCLSLELDRNTRNKYQNGQLQISLLNSSGKEIGLIDETEASLTSATALKKGSICYLGISCTDAKKFYTDYSIKTGIIASA